MLKAEKRRYPQFAKPVEARVFQSGSEFCKRRIVPGRSQFVGVVVDIDLVKKEKDFFWFNKKARICARIKKIFSHAKECGLPCFLTNISSSASSLAFIIKSFAELNALSSYLDFFDECVVRRILVHGKNGNGLLKPKAKIDYPKIDSYSIEFSLDNFLAEVAHKDDLPGTIYVGFALPEDVDLGKLKNLGNYILILA